MTHHDPELSRDIETRVRAALAEDIGSGDITARLIPAEQLAEERDYWPTAD
jgi:nicotinate-nucleotide pyrophosphorylase (carboxylating)